ncbi:DUF2723 domain-containing protein [Anaerolineales bacterium HSG25]|nr:DUF2723 domain-containing protein [Anaerolineales bacterium HSG25]
MATRFGRLAKALTLLYDKPMQSQFERFNLRSYALRFIAWPWESLLLIMGLGWLYLQTMPPGMSSWLIEGWDSAVLQITGSTWGIPHSPAYPLYTILANLFVRWLDLIPSLNQTSVVWRVSFWSTCTSLLTVLFLYFTIWKLSRDRITALVVSAVLGISFVFWRAAIMAEVYSLNALIFVLTYWLALTWTTYRRNRMLIVLGLLLGAGVVHHRTAFILPPTIALGVLLHSWHSCPRDTRPMRRLPRIATRLSILTGMAFVPLLTYLYLPWAAQNRIGQTWLYADASDWNTFWFMVMTREWWGLVQPPANSAEWLTAFKALFQQQADQITAGGVIFGLIGLLLAYRRLWLFGPPLIALTFFGTAYKVADLDSMLIPLTLTLCVGLGIFFGSITFTLTRWSILYIRIRDVRRKLVRQTTRVLIGLIIMGGGYLIYNPIAMTNYAEVDLSGDWQAEDLVEEVVAIAKAGTPLTIIGQDNSVLPDFIYADVVLGYDIEPLSTTTLSRMSDVESQQVLQHALADNRRVLIDLESIELGFIPWLNTAIANGQIFLAPTGHPYLWELIQRGKNHELPPYELWQTLPTGQFLEGQVSVLASHQQILHKRTGCFLRLTLFWQAHNPLDEDYFVAVQPLGGDAVLDKNDHLGLMRGFLPTSQLGTGEIVRDEVDLLIRQPTDLPLVSLVVNLYQVQGNEFPAFGEIELPIMADGKQCE